MKKLLFLILIASCAPAPKTMVIEKVDCVYPFSALAGDSATVRYLINEAHARGMFDLYIRTSTHTFKADNGLVEKAILFTGKEVEYEERDGVIVELKTAE